MPDRRATGSLTIDGFLYNQLEGRLDWAKLPLGCQLAQLVVGPEETVIGSSDDLSNFYGLRHHPEWWPSNAASSRIPGRLFHHWDCAEDVVYKACFKTVCMGDGNTSSCSYVAGGRSYEARRGRRAQNHSSR